MYMYVLLYLGRKFWQVRLYFEDSVQPIFPGTERATGIPVLYVQINSCSNRSVYRNYKYFY
jgi:hypothetical protein